MVVLAPTDFVAFSEATGTDYAATDEQKARIAPIVAQWKADVQDQQQQDRGPNLLGGALAGAGILAAGFGGAELARRLKRMGVREEVADEVAASHADSTAQAARAAQGASGAGLPVVELSGSSVSRARGEYDPKAPQNNPRWGPAIMDAVGNSAAEVELLNRMESKDPEFATRYSEWLSNTVARPENAAYKTPGEALAGVSNKERYGSITPGEFEESTEYTDRMGVGRRQGGTMYQEGYLEPEEKWGAEIALPTGGVLMRPAPHPENEREWIEVPVGAQEEKALWRLQEWYRNNMKDAKVPDRLTKSMLVKGSENADKAAEKSVLGYADVEDALTKGGIESLPATSKQWPRSRVAQGPLRNITEASPEQYDWGPSQGATIGSRELASGKRVPVLRRETYSVVERDPETGYHRPVAQGTTGEYGEPELVQVRPSASAYQGRTSPAMAGSDDEPWNYSTESHEQHPYILSELESPGMRAGARWRMAAKDHLERTGRPLTKREGLDIAERLAYQHGTDLNTVLNAANELSDEAGKGWKVPPKTDRPKPPSTPSVVSHLRGERGESAEAFAPLFKGQMPRHGPGESPASSDFLENVYKVLNVTYRLPMGQEKAAALGGDSEKLANSFISTIPGLGELFSDNLKGLSKQEQTSVVFEAISMAASDYEKALKAQPDLAAKAYAGGPGTSFFESFMKDYVRKATAMMGIQLSGGQGSQASLMKLGSGTSERLASNALRKQKALAAKGQVAPLDILMRKEIDAVIAGAESPAEAFMRLDGRTSNVRKDERFDDPNTNGSLLSERWWSMSSGDLGDTAAGQLKRRLAAMSGGTEGRPGVSSFPIALKLGSSTPGEGMFVGKTGTHEVHEVRKRAIEGEFESRIDESEKDPNWRRNATPGRESRSRSSASFVNLHRDKGSQGFPVNAEIKAEVKAIETELRLLDRIESDPAKRKARELELTQQKDNLIAEQREIDSNRLAIETVVGSFNTEAYGEGRNRRLVGPGHVLVNLGKGTVIDADARAYQAGVEMPRGARMTETGGEQQESWLGMKSDSTERDQRGQELQAAVDAAELLGTPEGEGITIPGSALEASPEGEAQGSYVGSDEAVDTMRRYSQRVEGDLTPEEREQADLAFRLRKVFDRRSEGEPMRVNEQQVQHALGLVQNAAPTLVRDRTGQAAVPSVSDQDVERARVGYLADFMDKLWGGGMKASDGELVPTRFGQNAPRWAEPSPGVLEARARRLAAI